MSIIHPVSLPPPSTAFHRELPGVTRIDHRGMGVPGAIASYLLADAGELALVEAGPAVTTATAALYETPVPYGMMAAGIHRFLTRGERPDPSLEKQGWRSWSRV